MLCGANIEMSLYSHQTAAHGKAQYGIGWCASTTAGKEKCCSEYTSVLEFPVSRYNTKVSATFPTGL
jgi:hypothetical protein